MNPEETSISPRNDGSLVQALSGGKRLVQRRLKDRITESRILEQLDRELGLNENSNQEEELQCESQMIIVEDKSPDDFDKRVCGVLKTVRSISRVRTIEGQQQENCIHSIQYQ